MPCPKEPLIHLGREGVEAVHHNTRRRNARMQRAATGWGGRSEDGLGTVRDKSLAVGSPVRGNLLGAVPEAH
eukprot:6200486-Pleurochrysis_carterae.AAC.2